MHLVVWTSRVSRERERQRKTVTRTKTKRNHRLLHNFATRTKNNLDQAGNTGNVNITLELESSNLRNTAALLQCATSFWWIAPAPSRDCFVVSSFVGFFTSGTRAFLAKIFVVMALLRGDLWISLLWSASLASGEWTALTPSGNTPSARYGQPSFPQPWI